MRIAVCDDQHAGIDAIVRAIANSQALCSIKPQVHKFHHGQKLLDSFGRGDDFDCIFIDVRMPDLTGVDVCGRLPERFDGVIIFVTAYPNEWPSFSAVNNYGFLWKNFTQDEFDKAVDTAFQRQKAQCHYEYTSGGIERTINTNRIRYFTVKEHLVKMHTFDEELTLTVQTLKEVEKVLLEHGFFKANRNMLINLRHFREHIGSNAFISAKQGTEAIPLSREGAKAVDKAHIRYKFERAKG
jgi:DNA-binding LytR/AlgR family response regulator